MNRDRAFGDFSSLTNEIRIQDGMPPEKEMTVFLHEVMHAALYTVRTIVDDDIEEQIVSTIAAMLTDTIISSDGFLNYLFDIANRCNMEEIEDVFERN